MRQETPRREQREARISAKTGIVVGYRHALRRIGRGALLVVLVQGAVALVAVPALAFMFSEGVRSAGLRSLTTDDISSLVTSPWGLGIVIASLVCAVIAIALQIMVFLVAANLRQAGITPGLRNITHAILSIANRLRRQPGTLMLIPYFVIVVPLAHIGVNSALTRWVAVPAFVSDELLKEPLHAVLYTAAMLGIAYLNLRLAFVMPAIVTTQVGVLGAFAASWRSTRWRSVQVLLLFAAIVLPLMALTALIGGVALLPVWLTDSLLPAASPVTAAIMFGLAQLLVFLVTGLMLWAQAHLLVAAYRGRAAQGSPVAQEPSPEALPRTAEPATAAAGAYPGASPASTPSGRTPNGRPLRLAIIVGGLVVVAALAVHSYAVIDERSTGETTILAHRGFTEGGVENTVPALEAAIDAQADVVELDVQQTADGEWVLMHDPDLKRLAGLDTRIADLAQADATQIEVKDEAGNTATIPSLEEYLQRASDGGQTLLIEVKVHGGETPDYLDRLIATVDGYGGQNDHYFHTLSAKVVDEMKQQYPDRAIGYIVPLSYGGAPVESSADFLVVEQAVYSHDVLHTVHASGKELYVWTVEDPRDMRHLFRDGVDGIISDRPDLGLAELERVQADARVLPVLLDDLRDLIKL